MYCQFLETGKFSKVAERLPVPPIHSYIAYVPHDASRTNGNPADFAVLAREINSTHLHTSTEKEKGGGRGGGAYRNDEYLCDC